MSRNNDKKKGTVWYFEMSNLLWFPLIIFGMSYVSVSKL